MGEAKTREAAARAALTELADRGPGTLTERHEVKLKPEQAAVVFALQRLTSAMRVESGQLAEVYGQREAAGEIASSVEHLNKFAMRFMAESQRSIVVPPFIIP